TRRAHRDGPVPAPELLGQPTRTAQLARVEVVNVPGRGFDRRSEPRTHEVDPLEPSIVGVAEGQLFDDRPASLVMQTEPIADPEAVGHVLRAAPLDLECVGLLEPASELIRDRGRAAQLAKAARQQPTEPDIRIKDRLYALEVPRRERLQERPADDVPPFHSLHSFTSSLVVTGRDGRPVGSTEERRDCRISGVPPPYLRSPYPPAGSRRPRSSAFRTASRRDRQPSLARMLRTCMSMVLALRNSSRPESPPCSRSATALRPSRSTFSPRDASSSTARAARGRAFNFRAVRYADTKSSIPRSRFPEATSAMAARTWISARSWGTASPERASSARSKWPAARSPSFSRSAISPRAWASAARVSDVPPVAAMLDSSSTHAAAWACSPRRAKNVVAQRSADTE